MNYKTIFLILLLTIFLLLFFYIAIILTPNFEMGKEVIKKVIGV